MLDISVVRPLAHRRECSRARDGSATTAFPGSSPGAAGPSPPAPTASCFAAVRPVRVRWPRPGPRFGRRPELPCRGARSRGAGARRDGAPGRVRDAAV